MAAGVLLVQEAGGHVSRYLNAPFELTTGSIIASNGLIHGELSELLELRS
jgi:myo-inositol-1(or 4)-monophosphatase